MKHSILKAVIFGQILAAAIMPANAAVVTLEVRPAVNAGGAVPCGSGQGSMITYEVGEQEVGPPPVGTDPVPSVINALVYTSSGPGCGATSRAIGAQGVLGIQGNVFDNSGAASLVRADALLMQSDIMLSPKAGETLVSLRNQHGPNVSVLPNLLLSGTISTISTSSAAGITSTARIWGENSTGQTVTSQTFVESISTLAGGVPAIGDFSFSGGSFAASIFGANNSNAPFEDGILIDPTRPFGLEFTLEGFASAGRFNNNQFGNASFDSFSSLSFDPNGPAFFVPEGFTVNAPSLNIFDNQWIDPRVAVPNPNPSTVPLPASGWLFMFAASVLAGLKRRQVCANVAT